ncbi:MAG: CDP-diacylglycerol--glycerol-3-phosphate 3-phosphatidyltransferase [Yoonia sp.]|jgi:CDP-diacylglycerol--glycerol-3-phosphate 3-phosphatidyltransferase|tara:strand:- start:1677 stop:2297 length:621 start_codon:yes stop_codon:yes gene_type:complete
MNWNIPNILTLLRLIAAPGVAIMFLYFHRPLADWFALILFVVAAFTDFLDGYLARAWKQESKFGAMMDPIADKAMVIIALVVITGFSGMNPWILLPAVLIIFREVFVSGLREFLGETAGLLKVTNLAKWKTTVQMAAISVLFAKGAFEHYLIDRTNGDVLGLRTLELGAEISWYLGIGLLWIAMVLTVLSGADYFGKSLPYLRDAP